jgi:serine protease
MMTASRRWLTLPLTLCLLPLPGHALPTHKGGTAPDAGYVSQIIVKMEPVAASASASPSATATTTRVSSSTVSTLSSRAGSSLTLVRTLSDGASVLRLASPVTASEAADMAQRISSQPGVAYASPDYRRHALAVGPNDTRYADQWGLFAPTATIAATTVVGGANLQPAWNINSGSNATVIAVIDTGVLPHADINAKLLPGYDFISDSFVANDGDGRDADASDPGDWVTNADLARAQCAGDSVENSSWHGTHVSGIAAASSNNGSGIAGVSWGARILPVRVLGKCGGTTSDIIDAIRWSAGLSVTGIPANPNPAKVINMSLGGGGACTAAEQSAIDDAYNAGVTIVVATGNDGNTSISSPANCNHVIAVTAHGVEGTSAVYANVGTGTTISAPGGGPGTDTAGHAAGIGLSILSLGNTGTTGPVSDTLLSYMGTSMATPHVAGAAALIHDVLPTASPARIQQVLTATARPHPAGSWCTLAGTPQFGKCGAGLLDVGAAMTAASGLLASNHAPVANPLTQQVSPSGRVMSFTVTGSDSDGDTLRFKATPASLPAGALLTESGTFLWLEPVAGSYSLVFTASDGLADSAPQTVSIRIIESGSDVSGLSPNNGSPSSSGSGGSFPPALLLLLAGLAWRSRRS